MEIRATSFKIISALNACIDSDLYIYIRINIAMFTREINYWFPISISIINNTISNYTLYKKQNHLYRHFCLELHDNEENPCWCPPTTSLIQPQALVQLSVSYFFLLAARFAFFTNCPKCSHLGRKSMSSEWPFICRWMRERSCGVRQRSNVAVCCRRIWWDNCSRAVPVQMAIKI